MVRENPQHHKGFIAVITNNYGISSVSLWVNHKYSPFPSTNFNFFFSSINHSTFSTAILPNDFPYTLLAVLFSPFFQYGWAIGNTFINLLLIHKTKLVRLSICTALTLDLSFYTINSLSYNKTATSNISYSTRAHWSCKLQAITRDLTSLAIFLRQWALSPKY